MGTLENRFNLHGRSFMQSTRRFFLKTPLGLQRAAFIGALGWGLAATMPAWAQGEWRTVSGARYAPPPSAAAIPAPVVTPVPSPAWVSMAAPVAPAASAATQTKAEPEGVAEGWLQMFGVRLSTATREEMRQAICREGLTVQREDDDFSEDIYDALNWMPGLLQLKFSYAREGQRLARVDYVFMTFADNAHVEDVKLRMEGRFGRAQRTTGREESGPYHAVWRFPDQMEIFLGREWPQRTTYLKFFNVAVLGQTTADSERESLQSRQGKLQNNSALPTWVTR